MAGMITEISSWVAGTMTGTEPPAPPEEVSPHIDLSASAAPHAAPTLDAGSTAATASTAAPESARDVVCQYPSSVAPPCSSCDVWRTLYADSFLEKPPGDPLDPEEGTADDYYGRLVSWLSDSLQKEDLITVDDKTLPLGRYLHTCRGQTDAVYKEGIQCAVTAAETLEFFGVAGTRARKRNKGGKSEKKSPSGVSLD